MRNTLVTLEVTNTEYGTVEIFTHVLSNCNKNVYSLLRDSRSTRQSNPNYESVSARMTANVWHNGNLETYVFADWTLESILYVLDLITTYGELADDFTDRVHAYVTSDRFRYCF